MSGSEQGSVADSRADGRSSGSTRAPSSASGSRASRRLPQRSEPWPKDGWRVRTWIMFCGLLQVTCQTERHSHWRATACCACATRRTLSLSNVRCWLPQVSLLNSTLALSWTINAVVPKSATLIIISVALGLVGESILIAFTFYECPSHSSPCACMRALPS